MLYIDIVLNDEQRAALIDKDVNFSEMTLGTEAYHRCGIAFSQEDCDAILEVLGLVKNDGARNRALHTPQERALDGYAELSLMPLPNRMEPIVWANRGQRAEGDEEAFQQLQAELGIGLSVKYCGYDNAFVEYCDRPGVLFVNVFSSPHETYIEDGNFRGGGERLLPKKAGKDYVPIRYSDRKPVAYFRGDSDGGSLWLLFSTYEGNQELVEYVLHTVARLMRPELGAVCSYKEYGNIAGRERYIGYASRHLKEEGRLIDQQVDQTAERIEEARRGLMGALQAAEALKLRREELRTGDQGEMLRKMKERLAKEFDVLASSSDFESLEFEENQVSATTRPIRLRYNGRIYEMGKYTIGLSREGYITIQSVKRHGHPHIRGGEPCFGNMSEGVAKLQAEMSYGVLLPFLVNYLENGYNPADSYSKIEDYDVKNYPERKEVKKPAKAKGKRRKAKSSKPRSKSAKRRNEVKK
jgi:hypothetical protein